MCDISNALVRSLIVIWDHTVLAATRQSRFDSHTILRKDTSSCSFLNQFVLFVFFERFTDGIMMN